MGNEGNPQGFFDEEETVGPDTVPVNAWTHLAFSYDGAHTRLYVNGELAATKAVGPIAAPSDGPLYIGCDGPIWGDHFRGRIDEVRLYDRALAAGEVGADMETPMQTPKAGPVAAWSLDEGSGTTAADATGAGNTATIEKATWTGGRYGDGLKFDGKKGCVNVPVTAALDDTEEFDRSRPG